jgi:predicted transcriptional regulator
MTEAAPTSPFSGPRPAKAVRVRMTLDKALDQLGQVERPLFVGKENGNVDERTNRKFEQPWNTAAITMRALGASVTDIAKDLGLTQAAVSSFLQTPWAQAQLRAKLEQSERSVLDILRSETIKNVETLVALRDDEKVSSNTRANIANSLLDRVLGKASQKIEVSSQASGDPVAEAELLKEQIARDAGKLKLSAAREAAGPTTQAATD